MEAVLHQITSHPSAVLALGAASLLAWWLIARPRGIPPGPRGVPLFGNYPQLSLATHLDFSEWGKTYGDVFSIYMGTQLVVILNSHRVMKQAFSTMGNMFVDRPKAAVLDPKKASLFMEPFGEAFSRDKKFALNAMRQAGYGNKGAEERMTGAADELSELFLQHGGKPLCVVQPFHKTAAKVVVGILFNKHHSFDDADLDELIFHVRDLLQNFTAEANLADSLPWLAPILFPKVVVGILFNKQHSFDDADLDELIFHVREFLQNFTAEANLADSLPWLAPILFPKVVKNCHRAIRNMVDTYIIKRIREHRQSFDPDHLRDFIDHYINSKERIFRDEEIAATCVTFMADAIDTNGYLMVWNMMLLALHPDWQTKLQEEIDQVIGTNRPPALADKAVLPLQEAFQQEALRFSAIFTLGLARKPLQDTELDGYLIPRYASVLGNFWAANRDPVLWPEPEKFKPERHLDADGNFIKTDKIWIFGLGRRGCMGEPLVKNENFLILVRLLQRFTFRFPEGTALPRMEDVKEEVLRKPPPFKVCALPR